MTNSKWVNCGLTLTLFFIVLGTLWLVFNQPIHVDEAMTYRHFVSQGWKIAISTYPFPNNHILFSVLGSLAVSIPMDPFTVMRMISFISALVSGFMLYRILRMGASITWSLVGVLLWCSSVVTLLYSAQARGYGMQTMFLILALHQAMKILDKAKQKNQISTWANWALLSVAVSCGIFTLPSFVIPALGLGFFLLVGLYQQEERFPWVKVLASVLFSIALTSCLYAPLIHYSGIESMTGTRWLLLRKFDQLPQGSVLSFLYDSWVLLGPSFLLPLVLLFWPNGNVPSWKANFLLFFLSSGLGYVLLFKSLPFPRTFSYLSAIAAVSLVWNIRGLSLWSEKKLIIGASLTAIFSLCFSFIKLTPSNEPPQITAMSLSENEKVLEMDTIYTDGWNQYGDMLDFYCWYKGNGPKVIPVYSGDVLDESSRSYGYKILTEEKLTNSACLLVVEANGVRIYDCR